MAFLAAIMECLTGITSSSEARYTPLLDAKHHQHQPIPSQSDADLAVAADLVSILRTAEKTGPSLQHRLRSAVGTMSWTENLARAVLQGVIDLVQEGREKMGPAMREALRTVEDEAHEAFGFVQGHPREVLAGLVIIVAVGILVVMMAPWIVEALGFAELGPVEGSFAAWWESLYAGYVPRGSLFSYLQRLGMTWK